MRARGFFPCFAHANFLFALLALVLYACGTENVAPTPAKNVTISGQVSLTDENPYLLHIATGVLVALDRTNFFAMTDSFGFWTITGVPAGTYDVTFSLPGYVSTRYRHFSFNSDTTKFFSSLGKVPSFNVTSITAIVAPDSIVLLGTLSNIAPHPRMVTVYFGVDSTVSFSNFRAGIGTDRVQPSDSTFRIWESPAGLRLNGFPTKGMRVYMAAYGRCNGSYFLDLTAGTGYEVDVSLVPARGSFASP